MKLKIQDSIFTQFPDFLAGVVVTRNINNKGSHLQIEQLLQSVGGPIKDAFSKLESASQHPNIISWRQTYKKFGTDPHQYRCSSESLVRRVLKGDMVQHINKVVDLYNYISLKYVIPVGGEDIDTLSGDLTLDFAKGDEQFIRLGGTENEPPLPGEVVYKDDQGVICRRWNWREGNRTKLTEETRNAIIVIDGLPPFGREQMEEATKELATLVQEYCGGDLTFVILDVADAEVALN